MAHGGMHKHNAQRATAQSRKPTEADKAGSKPKHAGKHGKHGDKGNKIEGMIKAVISRHNGETDPPKQE